MSKETLVDVLDHLYIHGNLTHEEREEASALVDEWLLDLERALGDSLGLVSVVLTERDVLGMTKGLFETNGNGMRVKGLEAVYNHLEEALVHVKGERLSYVPVLKGGEGSGHHGHSGRPGERGGSASAAGPGYVSRRHAMDELGVKYASRMNAYFKYGMPSVKEGGRRYVKWPEAKEWFETYESAGKGKAGVKAANDALKTKAPETELPKPPKAPIQGHGQKIQAPENVQSMARREAEFSLESAAERYDTTPAEMEEVIYSELKAITTSTPVSIRAPGEAAVAILDEGRFKTQFESGRSRGILDQDLRARSEENGLGLPRDLDPKERPVYGYIQAPDRKETAANYGVVEFKLHDTVKERTTITLGDSLAGFDKGTQAGVPALNPTKEGWDYRAEQAYEGYVHMEYIEAQVHGGVSVSDIASVRLDYRAFDPSGNLHAEYQPVVDRATALNIPVELDRGY